MGLDSVTSVTSPSPFLDRANQHTAAFGTPECAQFRKRIFSSNELLALPLASNYKSIASEKGYVEANRNLLSLHERLRVKDLDLTQDLETIECFAEEKAARCRAFLGRAGGNCETAYLHCSALAGRYGLQAPTPNEHDNLFSACVKRLCAGKWWKRKLRSLKVKTIEAVARDINLVNAGRCSYSSKYAQHSHQQQKQKTKAYLENTTLTNEDGQSFSLKDLYGKSVSNPKVRRAELMTRISGFEIVAEMLGHTAEFYTLTAPSRMHSHTKVNGKVYKNGKFDGSTPRQAQDYLCSIWDRIQAKLHRENLKVYGFRVAEPHHDGTPHWHMLFFMCPSIKSRVRQIIKFYALQRDGKEKGAKQRRFKAVSIEKEKGSAAGYIAKYISKNIDAAHISSDEHGNERNAINNGISAWASTWNIRQFQQIGGPSVSVWRELRRAARQKFNIDNQKANDAILIAEASDWAAYVMCMGGPTLERSKHPIRLEYMHPVDVDENTGELLEDGLTSYGDRKAKRIIGFNVDGESVITRRKKWVLTTSSPPPVFSVGAIQRSWTFSTESQGGSEAALDSDSYQ